MTRDLENFTHKNTILNKVNKYTFIVGDGASYQLWSVKDSSLTFMASHTVSLPIKLRTNVIFLQIRSHLLILNPPCAASRWIHTLELLHFILEEKVCLKTQCVI
jgi:hypothetical protein